MTDKYSRPVFQRLATSGLQPAKSQLKIKLDEIMNVEVSQAVVTSVESAVNWMTGSLYFVQLLKHQTDGPHAHLRELCQDSLTRLRQIGVVQISNNEVRPTPASHVMVSRPSFVHLNSSSIISNFALFRASIWSITKPWG